MKKKVEGGTHGITQTDDGESSTTDSRRDVGDAQGGSSAGSSRNEVRTYIGRHQETVEQWVSLRTILELCTVEKG